MTADTRSSRPPSPKALIDQYGQSAYDLAMEAAREAKARDHHSFIASWLTDPANTAEQTAATAPAPKNPGRNRELRCDNCNRQTWISDLVVSLGRAICTTEKPPGCLRLSRQDLPVWPDDDWAGADGELIPWPLTRRAQSAIAYDAAGGGT